MKKRLPFQQGKPILDSEILNFQPDISLESVNDASVATLFKYAYREWILSSKNNKVSGLDLFPYSSFSQGTTESFDKFYVRHSKRIFRVFKGEYIYHQIMFKTGLDWCFIDDSPLTKNDAIIISLPFANTGSNYNYEKVLIQASELEIPVLVDCCWFGVCSNLHFDFTYPCIEEITFSLSKTFPISRFRIGIRFYKKAYENDGILSYENDNYINYFSQHLGLSYLRRFGSDFIYNKYVKKQKELCTELNVNPSNCVSLATSSDERWRYLNRGVENSFRLSLSDRLLDV